MADLEEADVVRLPVDVELDRFEQPGQQLGAQDRLRAVERVLHLDRGRIQPGPLEVARGEEGRGPGFVVAGAGQDVADPAQLPLAGGQACRSRPAPPAGGSARSGGSPTVRATSSITSISRSRVQPPGRDPHHVHPGLHGRGDEADGRQQPDHVGVAQVGSEHGVDPGRAHLDDGRRRQRGVLPVDGRAPPHLGAAPSGLAMVPSRATNRSTATGGHRRVDAPLETDPGLRVQAQPPPGAGDGHRREPGGLQEHPTGARSDLGPAAAHDPTDADRRVPAASLMTQSSPSSSVRPRPA